MTDNPPDGVKCTCGCGSSELSVTIDKKRWFVDNDHVLTFIRKREAEMSKEFEEGKEKQARRKKGAKRTKKKTSSKRAGS
ncbi:MAG: hypothetical protein ACXACI_12170 [Candidatus Hodarchaeales archaeon]